MIVFLNPAAGGGTALKKWSQIRDELPSSGEGIEICSLADPAELALIVADAVARGETRLVAAGGDGTVHHLLNTLMMLPLDIRKQAILGAIGLGSSNDFHKPFVNSHLLRGVPLHIDFEHPCLRDVGVVEVTSNGHTVRRCFLINASIGLTAEGNRFFNSPDSMLGWLKKHNTALAILYAAVNSIFRHQNDLVRLHLVDGEPWQLSLTNLGVVKNPHFSGSLRYDLPIDYTSGTFGICVATDLGLLQRLRLLLSLSHGRFPRNNNAWVKSSSALTIEADNDFPVEVDGEILLGGTASFSIIPQGIKVCS